MRVHALLATLVLSALPLLGAFTAQAGDIAVVVHPGVKLDDVPFAELRKILLGDRQFWSAGQKVAIIVRSGAAPERSVLLDRVYQMNDSQYRQYWVGKVFKNEATAAPKAVSSNEAALELVGVTPGAVALVDVDDVPAGVKQLKVDGLKPGDKGYPLQR